MEPDSASGTAPSDGVVRLAQVEALLTNLSGSGIESNGPVKAQQALEALDGARLALLENEAIMARVGSGGKEDATEMQRHINQMKANLARAIESLPNGGNK